MHDDQTSDIWPFVDADAGHQPPEEERDGNAITPPPLPSGARKQSVDAGKPTGPPVAPLKEEHDPIKTPRTVKPKARLFPVLFGFIAGAVFWHLVGFWSLVADMVFSGPREKTVVITTSAPMTAGKNQANTRITHRSTIQKQRPLEAHNTVPLGGYNTLSAGGCTTLSQDTPGGPIKKVPCPQTSQTALEASTSNLTRSDFQEAGVVSIWEQSFALMKNQGWSNFTTGSIKRSHGQTTSPRNQEDWTTSLKAPPFPNRQ